MTIRELRLQQYFELMSLYIYHDSRWFKDVRDDIEKAHRNSKYYKNIRSRLPEENWKNRESLRNTVNVLDMQLNYE